MARSQYTSKAGVLDRHAQQFQQLKQEFKRLDYFCKGTVLRRMTKCGRSECACGSDPAKRHGPYFELTYKAKGTTVNVRLTSKSAPIYKAATQQYKTVKSLLNRLERLSRSVLARRPNRPNPTPNRSKNRGYFHSPGICDISPDSMITYPSS